MLALCGQCFFGQREVKTLFVRMIWMHSKKRCFSNKPRFLMYNSYEYRGVKVTPSPRLKVEIRPIFLKVLTFPFLNTPVCDVVKSQIIKVSSCCCNIKYTRLWWTAIMVKGIKHAQNTLHGSEYAFKLPGVEILPQCLIFKVKFSKVEVESEVSNRTKNCFHRWIKSIKLYN